MPTGIELYDQASALLARRPDEEGDELETWLDELETWLDASGQKLEAYRAVYQAANSRVMHFHAQAHAYADAAERELNLSERIEGLAVGLLRSAEEAYGAPEVRCSDSTTIGLRRRRSQAVIVVDEDAVPSVYVRTKVVKSVNKQAATPVLKSGEKIPGLELEERVTERVHWGV